MAEGWADPEEDPALINWEVRKPAAVIPFEVTRGRPVSPAGHVTTVRRGRNQLGRWGENLAGHAIITATYAGVRHLLMVERDGNGWAVPGGMADPDEDAVTTALRGLAGKTGLATVDLARCRPQPPRVLPDARGSDEAWVVTIPVMADLGAIPALPAADGGDDACRAAWIPARDYEDLARNLHVDHDGGRIFPAHVTMIAGFLAGPE